MDRTYDKSTTDWIDDTPVMSVEELSQKRTPMTRDGVELEVGMIVWGGNMEAVRVTMFEAIDEPREGVEGSYYFYLYGSLFTRFGKDSESPAHLRPENIYANPRNALHMGGWVRKGD